MIPNVHQSIEEIINNSTAQEKIIWQQVRLLTGENCAVRQLYYCGTIAASEFAAYTAGRGYLALNISFARSSSAAVAAGAISIYDLNNIICNYVRNDGFGWNATSAAFNYNSNYFEISNIIHSRITTAGTYDYIKFIGYRLIFG